VRQDGAGGQHLAQVPLLAGGAGGVEGPFAARAAVEVLPLQHPGDPLPGDWAGGRRQHDVEHVRRVVGGHGVGARGGAVRGGVEAVGGELRVGRIVEVGRVVLRGEHAGGGAVLGREQGAGHDRAVGEHARPVQFGGDVGAPVEVEEVDGGLALAGGEDDVRLPVGD